MNIDFQSYAIIFNLTFSHANIIFQAKFEESHHLI